MDRLRGWRRWSRLALRLLVHDHAVHAGAIGRGFLRVRSDERGLTARAQNAAKGAPLPFGCLPAESFPPESRRLGAAAGNHVRTHRRRADDGSAETPAHSTRCARGSTGTAGVGHQLVCGGRPGGSVRAVSIESPFAGYAQRPADKAALKESQSSEPWFSEAREEEE